MTRPEADFSTANRRPRAQAWECWRRGASRCRILRLRGNPMAAIAMVRMHHYTGDAGYRDKAEQTLETFAGVAEQFGIFAATYGIAVLHFLESPVQVVVVADEGDEAGRDLYLAAVAPFSFSKTT